MCLSFTWLAFLHTVAKVRGKEKNTYSGVRSGVKTVKHFKSHWILMEPCNNVVCCFTEQVPIRHRNILRRSDPLMHSQNFGLVKCISLMLLAMLFIFITHSGWPFTQLCMFACGKRWHYLKEDTVLSLWFIPVESSESVSSLGILVPEMVASRECGFSDG